MPAPDSPEVILTRLEGKLDNHAEQLAEHIHEGAVWQTETGALLRRLDENQRGNGKPGYNVRLDRLEQRERGRAKLAWIAASTGIAALAAWVSSLFSRG